MSKPHRHVKQEYISKVRYINDLPPPPLNPKFLEYNTTERSSTKTESEQVISSLFRKENFHSLIECIDEDMGMNLNLLNNKGFLDENDESVIGMFLNEKNKKDNKPVTLHEKDRELLRDAGIERIARSELGVSFLRRTEYISEKQFMKPSTNGVENGAHKLTKGKEDNEEKLDADAQLQAVEKTFADAQKTLQDFQSIKHPRRKNLKAVAAWPILPDTSMLDSKFLNVKFFGSASFSREMQLLKRQEKERYDEQFQKNSLETSIFRPITSDDGEWISLYQLREPQSTQVLKDKLNSSEKEKQVYVLDEEEDAEEYKFEHIKEYDMSFQRYNKPYEELAIKFASDGEPNLKGDRKRKAAYYYPVTGKIDLKKHRASTNAEINRFIRDSAYDIVNYKLREPNTNEMKRMDTIRSEFDPMEYEGEEEVAETNETQPNEEEQENKEQDNGSNINNDKDNNGETKPEDDSSFKHPEETNAIKKEKDAETDKESEGPAQDGITSY